MASEQYIQSKIMNWLKQEGYFPIKNMSVSVAGMPDITVIGQQSTFYIEVKKPGGRLSQIQQHVIAKIRAMNNKVYVIDSLNQLKEELNNG